MLSIKMIVEILTFSCILNKVKVNEVLSNLVSEQYLSYLLFSNSMAGRGDIFFKI